MEKFGSVFQQHVRASSHPRTGWEVGSRKALSGPRMEETPPSRASRLVSGYCQLGVAGAQSFTCLQFSALGLPAYPTQNSASVVWSPLRPTRAWYLEDCFLSRNHRWLDQSRDDGPMEGTFSTPMGTLSTPLHIALFCGGGMAGPAGLGDTLIW